MLRDGWNFHNDIAIALEGIATRYFGWVGRPMTKIFDADAIESGSFAEDMIILLRVKSDYSNELTDIDEFVVKAGPYVGKNGNTIDNEIAQKLFDEFKRLFEH